ncbi:MAG: hypothetical protein WC277_12350 [Bacilli bacterium]
MIVPVESLTVIYRLVPVAHQYTQTVEIERGDHSSASGSGQSPGTPLYARS